MFENAGPSGSLEGVYRNFLAIFGFGRNGPGGAVGTSGVGVTGFPTNAREPPWLQHPAQISIFVRLVLQSELDDVFQSTGEIFMC